MLDDGGVTTPGRTGGASRHGGRASARERLDRLVDQATLQVEARLAVRGAAAAVPHDRTERRPGRGAAGFELLPEPDDGDVFLDFEGHPFWRPDAGLFFLFGLLASATPTAQWALPASGGPTTASRRRPRRRA